jgi:Skp family chaperone for outer membrane proteins
VGLALAPASLSDQQAEETHQPGHRIAMIDVTYILKNIPAIKAHAAKAKADLEHEELEKSRRRNTLKHAVEHLRELEVGSAEYARQEEYVANLESKLRLPWVHPPRDLSETETRLYYDSYQQIAAAARDIAIENDIQIVLNFRSEEMDVEQNDSVFRGVMKNVVHHDSTVDITNAVMRYLLQRADSPQAAPSGDASSTTSL